MANNRIELATLPRFLSSPTGKTLSAADDVSVLLETGGVAYIFQAVTNSTAQAQAAAAVVDTSNRDRFDNHALILAVEFTNGVDAVAGFRPNWYLVIRGSNMANDTIRRVGTDVVDLSVASTTDSTSTLNTYTLTVDGTADATTIPVATWAQDGTTVIPRAKLPDQSYGDQFFFRGGTTGSTSTRNAGFPSFPSSTDAANNTDPTTGLTITWHQNDVAVILTNPGLTNQSSAAFLYIGTDQGTTPATTTDADWLSFGSAISVTKYNQYLTVINRAAVTATGAANTQTYTIATSSGGQDSITFTGSTFSLPLVIEVNINGVELVETLDYVIDSTRKIITFNSTSTGGWTFPAAGTDTVHIGGVTL